VLVILIPFLTRLIKDKEVTEDKDKEGTEDSAATTG